MGFVFLFVGIMWMLSLIYFRDGGCYYDDWFHILLRRLHEFVIANVLFFGVQSLYVGFGCDWNWSLIFTIIGIIAYSIVSIPFFIIIVLEDSLEEWIPNTKIYLNVIAWILWPITVLCFICGGIYFLIKDTAVGKWVSEHIPTITWEDK